MMRGFSLLWCRLTTVTRRGGPRATRDKLQPPALHCSFSHVPLLPRSRSPLDMILCPLPTILPLLCLPAAVPRRRPVSSPRLDAFLLPRSVSAVEEGRRQLPVDATVRRPQPVQPPQLLRVRRAAGLIDEYMSMASQVAIARMSAQDTLFRHCGTASRGAVGAGPDAGPGVRDAAAGGVPGEHRPEGRHVHGPRKAGDLLTSVLQEPAGREGPAGLGPGALHRPEVQAHRRRLGPERRYVQSGLRDGHWAGSGSRQGPMGTSVVLN